MFLGYLATSVVVLVGQALEVPVVEGIPNEIDPEGWIEGGLRIAGWAGAIATLLVALRAWRLVQPVRVMPFAIVAWLFISQSDIIAAVAVQPGSLVAALRGTVPVHSLASLLAIASGMAAAATWSTRARVLGPCLLGASLVLNGIANAVRWGELAAMGAGMTRMVLLELAQACGLLLLVTGLAVHRFAKPALGWAASGGMVLCAGYIAYGLHLAALPLVNADLQPFWQATFVVGRVSTLALMVPAAAVIVALGFGGRRARPAQPQPLTWRLWAAFPVAILASSWFGLTGPHLFDPPEAWATFAAAWSQGWPGADLLFVLLSGLAVAAPWGAVHVASQRLPPARAFATHVALLPATIGAHWIAYALSFQVLAAGATPGAWGLPGQLATGPWMSTLAHGALGLAAVALLPLATHLCWLWMPSQPVDDPAVSTHAEPVARPTTPTESTGPANGLSRGPPARKTFAR